MYAHELGFRLGILPVLYLVFTAVASLVSLPFGRLADRAGRKPVLLIFVKEGRADRQESESEIPNQAQSGTERSYFCFFF
jgi:hypothetical protein